jgi:hypothetical protein
MILHGQGVRRGEKEGTPTGCIDEVRELSQ